MFEEKLNLLNTYPRENREHILYTLAILSAYYIDNNQWNAALIVGERALSMISELTKRINTIYGLFARIYGMKNNRIKKVKIKEQNLVFTQSQYKSYYN